MLLNISRARAFCAILVIAIFCASGTAAADSPVFLGHAGANATDSGSSCTAYGYSAAGFTFPFSGVLTKYQVVVGDDRAASGELVRLRTVHSNGTLASAYVASEGAPNSVSTFASSTTPAFAARVPADAGDHLAVATTTDSPYAGRTHCTALLPSEVGHTGRFDGTTAVDVNQTWTDDTGRVPNVQAMLEPDVDQDGYGDGSQDLCPNKATIYQYACSGALYGTNTAVPQSATSNLACAPAFNCLRVQTAIGTISTASPFKGVIVRWRASSNVLANMRVRVVKPTDSSHFQIVRSSDFAAIAAAAAPTNSNMPPAMTIVPARVPIDQGDFIGLDIPSGPAVYYGTALPGSTYYDLANTADGGSVGKPGTSDKQVFYNADIERDADGDGYGDETQDLCPTDATRQTECLSAIDTTKPVITRLAASPKKFRVATKGAVVTKSMPKGTKIKFTLSEAATVEFSVYKVVKKKERFVHSFKRKAKSGSNSVAYSGRYRPAFKTKKLSPGSYRIKTVATDVAGNASVSRSATFTLAR